MDVEITLLNHEEIALIHEQQVRYQPLAEYKRLRKRLRRIARRIGDVHDREMRNVVRDKGKGEVYL